MRSQFHRLVPMLLLVAACGGDAGGGDTTPVVEIIKWTPSGDNQSAPAGQTLPLVIRVKVTEDGEVAAGHLVTFDGPGSFGTPSMTTGANGVATSSWTLPIEAGVVHATATLDGAVGSPITFTATGVAGTAVALNKISGDGQATTRNEIFNAPFVVQAVDQYGNGKPGVMIHWAVDAGATLAADSSPTDEFGFGNGYLRALDTLATVTLTATVDGLTGSPQTFTGMIIGATTVIQVQDDQFSPSSRSIRAGGAVKWQVVGTHGHTVTSTGGGVIQNSGVMSAGATWGPFVFDNPGTYTYECSEHPGMTGSITVTN